MVANIDSSIATSGLSPESCAYRVYKKDQNIYGGRVMLLVHIDIELTYAYRRTG